jgi:DNA-binding transcriptional regulator LsrR (DeoR family)
MMIKGVSGIDFINYLKVINYVRTKRRMCLENITIREIARRFRISRFEVGRTIFRLKKAGFMPIQIVYDRNGAHIREPWEKIPRELENERD